MAEKRERSRFWVVSTHVLTTGFAMPLLATIAALLAGELLGRFLGIWGIRVLALCDLVFLTAGYAGGTLYSLSYIRKNAIVQNPRSCIWPSIIAFAGLALAPCVAISVLTALAPIVVAIVLPYFLLVIVCFSVLTWYGFNRMAEEQAETNEE